MTRLRGLIAACLSLSLLLTACGGGGSTTNIVIPASLLGKQWRGTALSNLALAIVPGGGYALVGDVPELDWLQFQTNGASISLRQTTYGSGAWQTVATPRVSGVHGVVFNESSVVARAGDWTVLVGRIGLEIWAQLTGPAGLRSDPMPLSTNADPTVHAAVDATGKARVYWSETDGGLSVVHSMLFDSTTMAIDTGVVSAMSLDLLKTVAGPDGKGWLFYRLAGGHYARSVDAINGLGAPTRLDETILGAVHAQRLALAESSTRATTLALQGVGTANPCVGVRRLDAGVWSATTCINTVLSQGVSGGQAELAVEPGGQAVAVWRGGVSGKTLYAALRRVDGQWTSPSVVATVPSGATLVSVQAKVHTDGTAVVLYRQSDDVSTATPRAVMFDGAAQTWGAAQRIDTLDAPSVQLSVAFNSRGQAGVLSFALDHGAYQVRFAKLVNGEWTATSLQADADLAVTASGSVSTLASMQRLTPLGDGGWAAFWELNSGLLLNYGRQVVAAAYQ